MYHMQMAVMREFLLWYHDEIIIKRGVMRAICTFRNEIANRFPNFNGYTVEVWELVSNFMTLLGLWLFIHAGIKDDEKQTLNQQNDDWLHLCMISKSKYWGRENMATLW